MIRLHLIVEGQTEEAFADQELKPHLRDDWVKPEGEHVVEPGLSAAGLLAGLQCPKRLYLELHTPELAVRSENGPDWLQDETTLVRRTAVGLFPDTAGAGFDPDRTRTLLADQDLPVIHEAAFQGPDGPCRTDFLIRRPDNSWDLFMVHSGLAINSSWLATLAWSQYVLGQVGINVRHAGLIYPDSECRFEAGPTLETLFRQEDCMDRTWPLIDRLPPVIDQLRKIIDRPRPPEIKPGRQCRSQRGCPFRLHCSPPSPPTAIDRFYRMSATRKAKFRAQGITDIKDIPEGTDLTPLQRRIREAVVTDRPYISPGLARTLAALPQPWHYLDFETVSPPFPLFPGTRARDIIPFQWSMHIEVGGRLSHEEFLAFGRDDPRPGFIATLLDAAGTTGAILTYTHYERQVLRGLKPLFPHLAAKIEALAVRCVDLCALVRKHMYHPGFDMSFSLKHVLPALAPELDHAHLRIKEGLTASLAYLNMLLAPAEERPFDPGPALLEYCRRDTLALVAIKRYASGEPGVRPED